LSKTIYDKIFPLDEFGRYLKELRIKEKLSITELSLKTGVSNSYISQLENGLRGLPTEEVFEKLCRGLGVSLESAINEFRAIMLKKYLLDLMEKD
jgi:transcriptional regulator with XRE-family HTH domain